MDGRREKLDELLVPCGEPRRFSDVVRPVADALEPGRAGHSGFYLADAFAESLSLARAQARAAQAEYERVRRTHAHAAAAALGREALESNEFIVMRDEHYSLPPGIRVVRETPTYWLCELELDQQALEALSIRDLCLQNVAAQEDAVRAQLSARIAQNATELQRLADELGRLDVSIAQARFARMYDCVVPDTAIRGELAFEDARFLPLAEELQREGRAYEPISLQLNDPCVLTGPNMGGKSATLRTCGFLAVLSAFGVPVPAKRARIALFARIAWLGIGAEQRRDGLLSSFAQEVLRLQRLLEDRADPMLVLLDEFARTTTPAEGRALCIAALRVMRDRTKTALLATHLPGVESEAQVRHFTVRGLRMVPQRPVHADLESALRALAGSMDYAIVEVKRETAPHADAIALARLLSARRAGRGCAAGSAE